MSRSFRTMGSAKLGEGWIFLRPGRTARLASTALVELVRDLTAIEGRLVPGEDVRAACDAFVRWTEKAESTIRDHLSVDVREYLFDERFWKIQSLNIEGVRPSALVSGAVAHQRSWLDSIIDQLALFEAICGAPSATLAVVDTNVFDHFQMFAQIDWCTLLGVDEVRLLISLVVVDELDNQKDNRSSRLGARAGKVIRLMRSLEPAEVDGVYRVRDGVTLSFLPEPTGHVRRPSNDDEIVRQASYVNSVHEGNVVLVTGDFGMQLRARNLALSSLEMPDRFRIRPENGDNT